MRPMVVMSEMALFVVKTGMKILFIFTPFLVLSIFLGITRDYSALKRRKFALKATAAVAVICFVVYFFGSVIFSLFGITLDAFRIGAGALLFLNAINLVQDNVASVPAGGDDSIIVPFATPIIVGPAVMGVLFVIGADAEGFEQRIAGAAAVAAAIAVMGGLLLAATRVEELVGKAQLRIISKVTGLILAAISAQMIFTGIRNFMAGAAP
jgi:multiple antibiotic resistance protein